MPARGRTARDRRRRRLGQNFLDPAAAERFVDQAGFGSGEFVVEVGAGLGAITRALARRDVRVLAVELDPDWVRHLRQRCQDNQLVTVVEGDFLKQPLPRQPFRLAGSLPYARTTDILRHVLDDPSGALQRADVIVQWEVARKRAAVPPSTLLSTAWAPWWAFRLGARLPATLFRPRPKVDSGLLTILRRQPPLLPPTLAPAYARFVRDNWPPPAGPR